MQIIGGNELEIKLQNAPLAYMEVVEKQMRTVVDLLWNRVREKLDGQVLSKQSGKLYDSVQREVISGQNQVIGRVFSDGSVPYFGIQERGGQTRPHDIVPRNAQVLRFAVQTGRGHGFTMSDEVFATIVHHPGSKIPAHWFMRGTLEESVAIIKELFSLNEISLGRV